MPPLYQKQFKWQDDLIHNVALSFMKKDWVVKEIVYHPLKFAKHRMEDPDDPRPVRIRYFATFAMKQGKTKEWIKKFKEIYRNYDKYKDIVSQFSTKKGKPLNTSTEELFQQAVQYIGMSRLLLVYEIYDKGQVVEENQVKM